MAIQIYTIPNDRIVHNTKVDFNQRIAQQVIHVMQYDKSLPVIAVELFSKGLSYSLPSNAEVKVRWGKRDRTYVYKNVLGCDETRKIVYFDVDDQMTFFDGQCNPIIELMLGNNKAGSSYIPVVVDRNPIQADDFESISEYPELLEIVDDVQDLKYQVGTFGEEISNKADKSVVDDIVAAVPEQASSSNQLADRNFVNSSINSVTAYYITKNAAGDAFDSIVELMNTVPVYSGGVARTPTRNDYAIVRQDNLHDNATTRWIYQNSWQFQYVVNETALTSDQIAALNSGITANKVADIRKINYSQLENGSYMITIE